MQFGAYLSSQASCAVWIDSCDGSGILIGLLMADEKFWVSTGDIREHYEPLNLVFASSISFLTMDYPVACREVLDQLAQAAIVLGANGVIWISFQTNGNTLCASGTAVRVILS